MRRMWDLLAGLWSRLLRRPARVPDPILVARVPGASLVAPSLVRFRAVGVVGLRLVCTQVDAPGVTRLVSQGEAVVPARWATLWRYFTPEGGKGWTLEDGTPYRP